MLPSCSRVAEPDAFCTGISLLRTKGVWLISRNYAAVKSTKAVSGLVTKCSLLRFEPVVSGSVHEGWVCSSLATVVRKK